MFFFCYKIRIYRSQKTWSCDGPSTHIFIYRARYNLYVWRVGIFVDRDLLPFSLYNSQSNLRNLVHKGMKTLYVSLCEQWRSNPPIGWQVFIWFRSLFFFTITKCALKYVYRLRWICWREKSAVYIRNRLGVRLCFQWSFVEPINFSCTVIVNVIT